MRDNICIVILENGNGKLTINSARILNLRDGKMHYADSHPMSFYKACCNHKIGSIVCNCKPSTMRLFITQNNLKFSENKSILTLFEFLEIDKLSISDLSGFIGVLSLGLDFRGSVMNFEDIPLAERVATYILRWCERRITGNQVFLDFVRIASCTMAKTEKRTSESIFQYLQQICLKYGFDLSKKYTFDQLLQICKCREAIIEFDSSGRKIKEFILFRLDSSESPVLTIECPMQVEFILIMAYLDLLRIRTNISYNMMREYLKVRGLNSTIELRDIIKVENYRQSALDIMISTYGLN